MHVKMTTYDESTHVSNPSVLAEIVFQPYMMRGRLSKKSKASPVADPDYSEWVTNKIRRGHQYYYRCTAIQKTNGKPCPKPILAKEPLEHMCCKMHAPKFD